MIKVTKEDMERAIDWLEIEKFCCYALASALSGHHYESPMTTDEQTRIAICMVTAETGKQMKDYDF